MIHFDVSDPNNLAVEFRCNRCPAKHRSTFDTPLLAPAASLEAERRAIADGWKRDVPIPITRPRVTKYDKDGRPETVENEPGMMTGDLCPKCTSMYINVHSTETG